MAHHQTPTDNGPSGEAFRSAQVPSFLHPSEIIDALVEGNNLYHDLMNVLGIRSKYLDLVALVDAQLDLDLIGTVVVLEAEDRCVDTQLIHATPSLTSLEVVDSKNVVPEGNGVSRSKTVERIKQGLLNIHAEADGIVHIHVESLARSWQFDAEGNRVLGKVVEFATSPSRLPSGIGQVKLLFRITDPVILAGAEKCVLPFSLLKMLAIYL